MGAEKPLDTRSATTKPEAPSAISQAAVAVATAYRSNRYLDDQGQDSWTHLHTAFPQFSAGIAVVRQIGLMGAIRESFNTKSVAAEARSEFPEINDPEARRFLGDVLFSRMEAQPQERIKGLVFGIRADMASLPLLAGVAPEDIRLEHIIEGTLAYHELMGEETTI